MAAKSLRRFLFAVTFLLLPLSASADVVKEWNERALAAASQAKQLPYAATRTMALVHSAIFDAVNSVRGGYATYKVKSAATAGASAEAACVAAAHSILGKLFPDQAAALDTDYAASLAKIPDGASKTSGIAVGEEVGAKAFALRASDGSDTPNTYRPAAAPGAYVPTTFPIGSQWGNVTPWIMERGSQFRPPAPPKLTSPEWARDYNEIKDLGGKKSAIRTSEQSDIARCWIIVGPASWDPVVGQLSDVSGRSLIQNARLFALVEMAAADAYIAVFDAKYTYNFWRPITAIRNGDTDGNDATTRVSDWEPLIDTPLHPEYPCAHCITSAAVAAVLQAEFRSGSIPALSMVSPTAPGVTRKWTTIQEWADEVSEARIYGGIHYRNSAVVGKAMGKKIGELAVQRYLTPIH